MMLPPLSIPVIVDPQARDMELPAYATAGSAGLDLRAAIQESIRLAPGERTLVPCGFSMALPKGYEAQIRPRSGLAFKYGVTVLNAPGTIDADYRGEIKVLLINHGDEPFSIERHMRIAQMVVAPYNPALMEAVDAFPENTMTERSNPQWSLQKSPLQDVHQASERGEQGFGSTGVK